MFRRTSLIPAVLAGILVSGCAADGGSGSASPATPAPSASPAAVVEPSPVLAGASIDVAERTLARLELKGGPDFLAASGGLLWVKHETTDLRGLDPRTGEVRRSLQVTRNPDGLNGNCNGIGGDEQHLWTCSGPGVGLVGPTDSEVAPIPEIRKIADQMSLPVLADRVWVIEPSGEHINGLRAADGTDPVRLPLGARCADAVAGKGSYLWLACPTQGIGVRLDVDTGETVQIPGLRDVRTVAADRDVFFSYRMGLARVDQDSAEVTGAVAVAGATSLHAAAGAVWVRGGGDAFLSKLDADSLALLEEMTAPEQGGGSVLLAFDALWASAYDENVLYRLRAG